MGKDLAQAIFEPNIFP